MDLRTDGSQKRCAGSAPIRGADTMAKSWGEAATQSKNGFHTASRLLPIEALEDHRNRDEARPKADLFAPMRIE